MSYEQPQFNKLSFPVSSTASSESRSKTEQIAGIKFSAEKGMEIQKTCPEIAMEFVNGLYASEIVEKYDIQKKFSIDNPNTAKAAVMNAIGGYRGNLSEDYEGLIKDPDIVRMIAKKHRENSRMKVGNMLKEQGKGIHAHSVEERKEISRRGVIARGNTPISDAEKTLIQDLASQLEYKIISRNSVNSEKIAQEVNEKFHHGKKVRNSDTITSFLSKVRKQSA